MPTTDPNVVAFLESLNEFYSSEAGKITDGKHKYLEFPEALEADDLAFAKDASDKYQEVLKDKNDNQDPIKMITLANSYYYIKALGKAHRLYRRDRIADACLNLSYAKGIKKAQDSTTTTSVLDNLRMLGTVITSKVGDLPLKGG